jgi:hypothetical protein
VLKSTRFSKEQHVFSQFHFVDIYKVLVESNVLLANTYSLKSKGSYWMRYVSSNIWDWNQSVEWIEINKVFQKKKVLKSTRINWKWQAHGIKVYVEINDEFFLGMVFEINKDFYGYIPGWIEINQCGLITTRLCWNLPSRVDFNEETVELH